MSVSQVTAGWDRWRRFCGYAALIAAVCWAAKFAVWAVLAARYTEGRVDDHPVGPSLLVALVAFLLPTVGSVLGLVAGSGLVAPWARSRPWFVGVPLAVLCALAVTLVLSTLSNATAAVFAGAGSEVWSVEGTDLVTSVLLAVLGGVLLRGRGRAVRGDDPGVASAAPFAPSIEEAT